MSRHHQANRYFLNDPEGDGFELFPSAEARDAAAKKAIAEYCMTGEWIDGASLICTGELTHTVEMTGLIERPDDVDEDGFGPDGEDWNGVESKCNYELVAIKGQTT